ncbi:STAS domain-containing protein [Pelagicoccus mobilis]|uniref:STAS domain-containing protein n=1 Tax=Pelagicoccus mobilis TaxID=415221 RepID=A0A934RZ07_9BACT|nr:STAS domain-containing protein [Pelagicoccus mobilis]MBK1877471.1 STAS domain-containing protein [Pelagicoccus mobilis]
MNTTEHPTTPPLELAGSLSIQNASNLLAELLQFLESNEKPRIDLEGIDSVDTIGLQLLISASASNDVTWLNPPECLRDHCQAVGYDFKNFSNQQSKEQ